jgi:hypothetical protein
MRFRRRSEQRPPPAIVLAIPMVGPTRLVRERVPSRYDPGLVVRESAERRLLL